MLWLIIVCKLKEDEECIVIIISVPFEFSCVFGHCLCCAFPQKFPKRARAPVVLYKNLSIWTSLWLQWTGFLAHSLKQRAGLFITFTDYYLSAVWSCVLSVLQPNFSRRIHLRRNNYRYEILPHCVASYYELVSFQFVQTGYWNHVL